VSPVPRLAAVVLALVAVSATAATRDADVSAHPFIPGAIRFHLPVELGRGSFADVVNVSWAGTPYSGFASGAISITTSAFSNITFDPAKSEGMFVYDNLGGSLGGTGSLLASPSSLSFSNIAVTGGDFSVELRGTATGAFGGEYVLGGSVVPVPEPETYAMMLAGVVAVGFLAARRRRRS
jgi:hypothetical protein